jgi:type VI secretion system protein ImpC
MQGMAKSISFGNIGIGLTAGATAATARPEGGGPFQMALLGDFSGRSSRGLRDAGPQLAGRRPLLVDRDNFDEVLAKLGVAVRLQGAGGAGAVDIRFRELDDFHPDRLYRHLEMFQSLRQTRDRLHNPATFAAAAAEVHSWSQGRSAEAGRPPEAPPPELAALAPEQLLDQIIGGPLDRPAPTAAPQESTDWNAFLRSVAAPYSIPRPDPKQPELVAQVDAATGALMRAVLHHPIFQALEALWRSVHFLVRRLDTDHGLKLCLLDVSRAELESDLAAAEDLGATGLYRLLVEQTVGTPGAAPWAVLVGHYSFAATTADVGLLGRLTQIAQRAGAPFLGAATPSFVGCPSLARTPDPDDWTTALEPETREAWEALRRLPAATCLGLVLPRFLLRLPYGKDTDPAESFPFEELPPGASHEDYLWGNPAMAAAYLFGAAFNHAGWQLRPGMVQDIDGLPVHVYQNDGESESKPCAEVLLTHRAADAILDRGIMPLLSVRGTDQVRLAAFRSIAEPARPLAGRWH